MRTSNLLMALALAVLLLVQAALMFQRAAPPPAPLVTPPPAVPVTADLRVVDAERRLAQVETRLRELQELLKDKPLVRRLGGRDEAPNHSAAPVDYDRWVAILSAPGAAAVVRFTAEPDGAAGAGYRYRSVRAGKAGEERGEGKVFEKYRRLPGEKPDETFVIDDGGQLMVEAGALRVEWSCGSGGQGYIYYDPGKMRVYLAAPAEFETVDLGRYVR